MMTDLEVHELPTMSYIIQLAEQSFVVESVSSCYQLQYDLFKVVLFQTKRSI